MIKPIRTEEQYEKSLERAYELMQKDIELNTEDADELEIISILIKNYEDENYPLEKSNYSEVIQEIKNLQELVSKKLYELKEKISLKKEDENNENSEIIKISFTSNDVINQNKAKKKILPLYLETDFYSKLKLIQIEENGDKTMNKFIISILENYLENK